jgi:hypothetical protein
MEIKERIEAEWLQRALPRVKVVEIAWNLNEGTLLAGSLSDTDAEQIRKRFYQSFGLRLVPWSPLDYLATPEAAEAMLAVAPAQLADPQAPREEAF